MSKNLTLSVETKITAQLKLQQVAQERLKAKNKEAAREILLRVQLILSRNQIK